MNRFNPFVRPEIAMPTQVPLVRPEITTAVQESVAFLPRGYIGPGKYRVTAPRGLDLRYTPDVNRPANGFMPSGQIVDVLSVTKNGWVYIHSRILSRPFYVCMSCAEVPGGPWLVPVSAAEMPEIAMPRGYVGPGKYRITAPRGLDLRFSPDVNRPAIGSISQGQIVDVLNVAPNGWVHIYSSTLPQPYFVCMSCPEVPGGPWLVHESSTMVSGRPVG